MKRFLLWIWQLPQNVIGFLMTRGYIFKGWVDIETLFPVYYTNNVFGAGVCLGDYIILDYENYCGKAHNAESKKHEYGHHKQSLMLGPLYLIIVGIPSFVRNFINRYCHYKMTVEERIRWYYKGFPENWADKLGGVKRFDD